MSGLVWARGVGVSGRDERACLDGRNGRVWVAAKMDKVAARASVKVPMSFVV